MTEAGQSLIYNASKAMKWNVMFLAGLCEHDVGGTKTCKNRNKNKNICAVHALMQASADQYIRHDVHLLLCIQITDT